VPLAADFITGLGAEIVVAFSSGFKPTFLDDNSSGVIDCVVPLAADFIIDAALGGAALAVAGADSGFNPALRSASLSAVIDDVTPLVIDF
jgi:hypothetical protein